MISEQQSILSQLEQYLTFTIMTEKYCIDLKFTREIIQYDTVTTVPLMPAFVAGVINLRGDVVPVIDLAIRLGRPATQIHKRTCIIIVEFNFSNQHAVLGLLADAVNEVVDLENIQIEDSPNFGTSIQAEFIQGIVKQQDEFMILLNCEKALAPEELGQVISEAVKTEQVE